MVGFHVRLGYWIDKIGIVCAELQSDSTRCIRHLLSNAEYASCLSAQQSTQREIATATTDTGMYDTTAGGDAICTVRRGDTGNYLGTDANERSWVHIEGTSGECSGMTGWVWHDGQNQPSLTFSFGPGFKSLAGKSGAAAKQAAKPAAAATTGTAASGKHMVTVPQDVDFYPQPGGNGAASGSVPAGSKVTLMDVRTNGAISRAVP